MISSRGPLIHTDFEETARRLPEKCALVQGTRRVTYAELSDSVARWARVLVAAGVSRGDRVILLGDNGIEVAIGFFATLAADAVAVPLAPALHAERLTMAAIETGAVVLVADARMAHIVAQCVLRTTSLRRVFFFDPPTGPGPESKAALELLEKALRNGPAEVAARVAVEGLRAAIPRVDARTITTTTTSASGSGSGNGNGNAPNANANANVTRGELRISALPCRVTQLDLAIVIFTSGSTGMPKGVMHTHGSMLAAAVSVAEYLQIREDDVIFNLLPFSFSYGLYQLILAFRAGARVVIGRSIGFSAEVVQTLIQERVTILPGVPAYFAILAGVDKIREYDFSSVRCVTNAASALPAKRVADIREIFPNARIFSMYGQTECKRATYLPPDQLEARPSSVGIAIPRSELWLEDENGNRVAPGETGELVMRGPTLMLGYWNDPVGTALRLRPGPTGGERVIHTGDLFRQDEEGFLYFVSRMDDIVKCGGEKVAPSEVEQVLQRLPGVGEVAVVGAPDDIMGEALHAFVTVTAPELTPRDIQKHCRASLELFKVPKTVEIVPDLPRVTSGKIDKAALKAAAKARIESATGT